MVVQRGPRAGTEFSLPSGSARLLGSDEGVSWRLPDLAPRAAVFRRGARFEVQLLVEAELNGEPAPLGAWLELNHEDRLRLGPHDLGVRSAPPPPPVAPAGFSIERELGRGGFGVVYAARRERDGARVALKVLSWARPGHLERFRREGATCLALDHPAIVRVLELGVRDSPPWLAMELVAGEDAGSLVRRELPSVERAVSIAADVAEALAWLARHRLVHRDVKLENVLIAPERAKLSDFGLVKDLSADLSQLTRSGVAMGTLAYAAPEQLRDAREVTPASDVYGLGVTLFGLLSGRLPWSLSGADARAALSAPPLDLRELRPEVPNILSTLVRSMLERSPAARPRAEHVVPRLRQLI